MTKTDSNSGETTIKLVTLNLIESSIFPKGKEIQPSTIFNFKISVEHLVSVEKDQLNVICKIEIGHSVENIVYGKITSSCVFEVKGIHKFKEGKTIKLPGNVIAQINSVSISTTRGIMFSQFKGTFLHNAILPLIDIK